MRLLKALFKNLSLIWWDLRSGEPLKVGRSLTLIFVSLVLVLAILPQRTEHGASIRIVQFFGAPFNEIGDAFAGVAGVLAFLWIIITVWLQSMELEEQRRELAAQRKATQEISDTQKKHLEIIEVQAEIFRDEQRQRSEVEAKLEVDQLLVGVSYAIQSKPLSSTKWFYDDKSERFTAPGFGAELFDPTRAKDGDVDKWIRSLADNTVNTEVLVSKWVDSRLISKLPKKPEGLAELIERFDEIMLIYPRLSAPQKKRIKNLQIEKLRDTLKVIYRNEKFWSVL